MGKNGWIALLLALALLAGTALPVFAAGTQVPAVEGYDREDEYGGLAPPPEDNTPRPPARPAGEEDNGGIAPVPEDNTPPQPSRPAGEEDNGGIAPVPEDNTPRPPSRPAGAGDNGGVAPSQAYSDNASPQKRQGSSRTADLAGKIPAGIPLSTALHTAYAYGSGGAFPAFNPTRQVTRAEAAQMICRLLPERSVSSGTSYSDVPDGVWYAAAVKTLADLGVIDAQDGRVEPGRQVTRGEFTRYLASFFPLRTEGDLFDDVPESDPNAPYILSARAYGWAQGGADGLFHPDEVINRAAAVVLMNRALGRTADKVYIDSQHPAFYVDVAPSSWYYYDVIEATVGHEHSVSGGAERWTAHTPRSETPKDGLQLVDGWLYCYDSGRGDLVRNETRGNRTFNHLGRFTTGNNDLDAWLHKIVLARTDSSMTQEEMLRALFLYTRDSFTYLRRPPYEFGVYDYMETDALRILNTGYGNCYCYASLFWYLTRWIGYDSVIYNGTVGVRRSPHSWVEISLNGRSYIFDTELEMAYRRKKRFDVNLYKFYDAANSWNYRRPKAGGAAG